MNHDDSHDSGTKPPVDSATEARIVAWVLGEASAFEIAGLERLLAAEPELALFRRRIEAVHGLMGEAEIKRTDTLRLAPERRAKLLATFGGVTSEAHPVEPDQSPVAAVEPARKLSERPARWKIWLVCGGGAVASLVLIFAVVGLRMDRVFGGSRSKSYHELRMEPAEGHEMAMPELFEGDYKQQVEFGLSGSDGASAPTAVGGIAVPVSRSFGAGKAVPMRSDSASSLDAPSVEVGETYPLNENDRIELAPFEVKAGQDVGYTAASTLSGTRISTDLKDLGSGISVVNEGFLADTGATNGDSVLAYSTNTEVGGVGEKFKRDADAAATVWSDGFAWAGAESPAPPSVALPEEEKIVLSPFEVSAPRSRGLVSDELAVRPNPSRTASVGYGQAPAAPPPAKPAPFSKEADKKVERAKAQVAPPEAIDEAHAAKEPVSTFSLHVSDASFRVAQAALARGQAPDPAAIRPEEFYNAFDYGDPSPRIEDKVGCRIEQAAHPFLQQRNLVRIAMKVAATGRGAGTPLRLTVLLDTSGSMEREDRAAAVRRALEVLTSLLGENDRITLIGFSRQPRLLAESVRGNEAGRLVGLAAQTPADGGTNLEEALKLAAELALRQFAPAAQNRIVLLTDGAANLGNADPAQLAARIEELRAREIAFDACGVGTDGLDDEILEALTRKGDGRYTVLDTPEDADEGFARQLAGAFRPAAKNVKVQVRFNPARVGAYRLLGFEKHRLREEDFRNDKVDAAELAGEEAAVAVYQVEVLPQGEGELGDVFVRFRDMATGTMVERSWTMVHDARAKSFDQASPTLQLAGTAALLAEKLRGGALADQVDLGELGPVVNGLRAHYPETKRVQELASMFETMRRIHGQ